MYEVVKKEHQWHWVNNFLLFGFFTSVIVAILLQFRLFFCGQNVLHFFFRIYLGYILVTEGESQTIFAMISFLSDYLEILFQRKTISISLASLCNLILVTVLPCYEKYGNWINLQKMFHFFLDFSFLFEPSFWVRELAEAVMDSAMSPPLGMSRSPITIIQCCSASTYRSWFYHPHDSTSLSWFDKLLVRTGGSVGELCKSHFQPPLIKDFVIINELRSNRKSESLQWKEKKFHKRNCFSSLCAQIVSHSETIV